MSSVTEPKVSAARFRLDSISPEMGNNDPICLNDKLVLTLIQNMAKSSLTMPRSLRWLEKDRKNRDEMLIENLVSGQEDR
ncbi:unnamed protein product [Adineta steineri]|uniref:Uncharacterized protein n=1 Tax=Adineta steineri TaxID=433720 RepID=A0A819ZRA4_9BILA|nr:unnamed protein product [Adineta steineri]